MKVMTQPETKISPDERPDPDGYDLPTSPDKLLARLDALGIAYELHDHDPVFTVAESSALDREIGGTPCRNLFLRDKKKKNYLVVLPNERPVDLKSLPDQIGSGRLSFGSAERLWEYLGVRPGSVCPFAITNDTDHQVQIVLDAKMMESKTVCYHPLLNNRTICLLPDDLLKFIAETGHTPMIVDFTAPPT
jgi:Ala-tRNA(Pro) deacylase